MSELRKIYTAYEDYLLNNGKDVQEIQCLANRYIKQLGLDLTTGDKHASASFNLLAASFEEVRLAELGSATETKDLWKYVNCLELLTLGVCTYSSDPAFSSLADPLMLHLFGAACMFSTANYFPLRLRCVNMANHIGAATNSRDHHSSIILVDMLQILHKSPKQPGVSIDFRIVLRVDDGTVASRLFQEQCVRFLVDELAQHLAQLSYLHIFPELSTGTLSRLNGYVNDFAAVKDLVAEIEANVIYIKTKRKGVKAGSKNAEESSFLQAEKKKGWSPLSEYVAFLREEAQQSEEVAVLKISWPLGGKPSSKLIKKKRKGMKEVSQQPEQPNSLRALAKKARNEVISRQLKNLHKK